MKAKRPQKFTATGDVTGAATGGHAVVILTPAAALSTVDVRQNGSGGTVIMSLQAAASGVSVVSPDFYFEGQLHVTLSGASASVTVLT